MRNTQARLPLIDLLEPRTLFAFGNVDTAWATAGRVISNVGTPNSTVISLATLGGKVYASGNKVVTRYNGDGSLDASFGDAGKAAIANDGVQQEIVASSGEVYVLSVDNAGTAVTKLKSNGVIDSAFGTSGTAVVTSDGQAKFAPKSIAYAGGKLLIVGLRTNSANDTITQVYRLKGNGALDSTFGDNGSVQYRLGKTNKSTPFSVDQTVAIRSLPNGEIALAGSSMAWNPLARDPVNHPIYGNAYLTAARLRSSGRLDTTYGEGGIARNGIPSGQIISRTVDEDLTSQFPYYSLTAATIKSDGSALVVSRAVRLTVGSFDSNGGVAFTSVADANFQLELPSGVTMLPDGRAVVSGLANPFYRGHGVALMQVSSAGELSSYVLSDDLKPGTVELIDDDPGAPDDQFFRPHPIVTSSDGEVIVGGGPATGNGFELEKFKVGTASDPRPGVFPGGTSNDLVIDDNLGLHLAYYDENLHVLKYAYRAVNGQWSTPVTVDSSQYAGDYLSIALSAAGQPSIAYHDGLNSDLKFARSTDLGKTWTTQTVDSSGATGLYPSLVVDAADGSNRTMITYYRKTTGDLRFATLNGTTWTISNVDTAGNVGRSSRLYQTDNALTPEPVVAYVDSSNNQVKLATLQSSNSWKKEVIASLSGAADYLSIDLGSQPLSVAFYDAYNADLRIAYNNTAAWVDPIVASKGAVGLYTAVTSFTRSDSSAQEQVYGYNKTTNSVSLFAFAASGGPFEIPSLSDGGKYLSLARNNEMRIETGDASFIDSALASSLRVGTLFSPIDDRAIASD